jgi:hypothetical protein
VVDFSSTVRIPKRDLPRAFTAIAGVLGPGGRVLTSPRPKFPDDAFGDWGLRIVRADVVQECPMLAGGKSINRWWELAAVSDSSRYNVQGGLTRRAQPKQLPNPGA